MIIFKGKIKGPKFTLDDRKKFEEYVFGQTDGDYTLTIDKVKDNRSLRQNAYYFGVVIRIISNETGHTPDETHEILKYYFLKVYNDKGEVIRLKSTKELSTSEFEEYMSKIRMKFASQMDIQIPEPNETIYGY